MQLPCKFRQCLKHHHPLWLNRAIDNVTAKSPPPESGTGLCPDGNDEAWINVARDGDTAASNCETVHSDVNP